MASWTLLERELHVNTCLDALEGYKRYVCPTCGQDLSQSDELQRSEHANRCIDRAEAVDSDAGSETECVFVKDITKDEEVKMGLDLLPTQIAEEAQTQGHAGLTCESEYRSECKICGIDMQEIDLMCRVRHVKSCGQKFGVRSEFMGRVEQTETAAPKTKKQRELPKLNLNAFGIITKPSLQNAKAPVAEFANSNVFDVLMRSSKSAAILNARKRPVPLKFTRKAVQRRRLSYPDCKCIQGTNPPFIVDGFKYACKENSSIYFLTHFHSDHYGGITKEFNCGIIYCSEITAKLVVLQLGVQSKYVFPVGMNSTVLVADVQVSFMDANHCPGSVIILFRLKNGKTYLHTGDFRFHKTMLERRALQTYIPTGHENIDNSCKIVGLKRLDGVYLDTTYCNPKYTFPSQRVAIDHAIELVGKHLKQDGILFLFGSYTIGKERLYLEIARKIQQKVCVSRTKQKIIESFGWPAETMQLLTTEPAATNFHVVGMQDLQMDSLKLLLAKHRLRFQRIVAFRPTGWTYGSKNSRSISTCCTDPSGKIRVYGIPYSEHSSFAELCDFVQVVNPATIIPTVNCSSKRKATNQVNILRQAAFHNIPRLFMQQQMHVKQQQQE